MQCNQLGNASQSCDVFGPVTGEENRLENMKTGWRSEENRMCAGNVGTQMAFNAIARLTGSIFPHPALNELKAPAPAVPSSKAFCERETGIAITLSSVRHHSFSVGSRLLISRMNLSSPVLAEAKFQSPLVYF